MRSDTRPRHFPPSTSDTVACDTPAARATSLLVGRAPPAGSRVCTLASALGPRAPREWTRGI
ncbi:hypothetical protein SSP531S_32830 [Streptomyces spongiicola]|uniref:Uncharacterized protein n=1 Tax=Streptomyces spongiicola TaxID=1690221 RepID=A0A388T3N4_9ACTN|nr:hypothetical protein SSP531S_32830 [Streptomyces spongiicola]